MPYAGLWNLDHLSCLCSPQMLQLHKSTISSSGSFHVPFSVLEAVLILKWYVPLMPTRHKAFVSVLHGQSVSYSTITLCMRGRTEQACVCMHFSKGKGGGNLKYENENHVKWWALARKHIKYKEKFLSDQLVVQRAKCWGGKDCMTAEPVYNSSCGAYAASWIAVWKHRVEGY